MRRALLLVVFCLPGFAEEKKKTREQLIEIGRAIFTERCPECHNAGGDKVLETGVALSEMRLDDGDVRANVAGRLGPKATDEQREAVRLYVLSINRYSK